MINQLMSLGYVSGGWNYTVGEHHIYGSSRIGVHQTTLLLRTRYASGEISITLEDKEYSEMYRGKRHYELSNHLGNVQVVVSDKRISVCDTELEVEYFKAEVLSAMDYYPFGMMMPDRQWYAGSDSSGYRYGFNGQEKDNEVSGNGNTIEYKYRIHDSRLGRFLSVDPLFASYPWNSPYAFCENRVIDGIELEGLERVAFNEDRADGVVYQVDYTVTNDQTNTPGGVITTQTTNHTMNAAGRSTGSAPTTLTSGTSQKVNGAINVASNRGTGAGARDAQPTANPAPGSIAQGTLGLPNQFNGALIVTPNGGTAGPGAAVPAINFTNNVTNLVNNTPAAGTPGTQVIAGNTSRIMVVTNGTATSIANAQALVGTTSIPATPTSPAVPATGLMATYPDIQFSIVSDPAWQGGLNNDQVGLIQNPTQDFLTPGNPANIFGLNPVTIMNWSNNTSGGLGSPPLLRPPVVPQ